MLHTRLSDYGWNQGRLQGGKWTQLAFSFAQGGFLPPPARFADTAGL